VTPERDDRSEPPPLIGSWRNVYALIVLVLAVLICLFYALTRWAS
jgi:hypothetical protein